MITVAFDIDGTAVDVWDRYWGIYAQCMEAQGVVPVPIEIYRAEVRKGIANFRLFDQWHSQALYQDYLSFRNSRLEALDYLRRDHVVPEMEAALNYLSVHFRLIAVSARDDASTLHQQLVRLGIAPLFATVHATKLYGGATAKADVLQREKAMMIIGDTEVDLQAAGEAGITAIPVSWGLRSADFLRLHTDTAIFNSPRQMVKACMALCTAAS